MSNVVQFLEALARNPNPLSKEELASAMAQAQLEPATQQAMLDGDTEALNHALGAPATVLCFVVPAENDEPQEGDEKDGEDAPQQEPSSRAVA